MIKLLLPLSVIAAVSIFVGTAFLHFDDMLFTLIGMLTPFLLLTSMLLVPILKQKFGKQKEKIHTVKTGNG